MAVVSRPSPTRSIPSASRATLRSSTRTGRSASLGFRLHAGWATAVALGGPAPSPVVLLRRRVELWDPKVPESAGPWHAAMENPGPAAATLVERGSGAEAPPSHLRARAPAQGAGPSRGAALAGGRASGRAGRLGDAPALSDRTLLTQDSNASEASWTFRRRWLSMASHAKRSQIE